jgi:hypothetical protein
MTWSKLGIFAGGLLGTKKVITGGMHYGYI